MEKIIGCIRSNLGCSLLILAAMVAGCSGRAGIEEEEMVRAAKSEAAPQKPHDIDRGASPSKTHPTHPAKAERIKDSTAASDIQVKLPKPNTVIRTQRFEIAGMVRAIKNNLAYRLLDSSGGVLAEGSFSASGSKGELSPFSETIATPVEYGGAATLEIFHYSALEEKSIDGMMIPIVIEKIPERKNDDDVKLFYTMYGNAPFRGLS